jgi:hypothetical protein
MKSLDFVQRTCGKSVQAAAWSRKSLLQGGLRLAIL